MTGDLAMLQDYIDRCSNWGRWGPDDQLGTVNLITADKIRATRPPWSGPARRSR